MNPTRAKLFLYSLLWLVTILCPKSVCAEGLAAGTLIATQDGLCPIETLTPGATVTSCTWFGQPTTAKITKITRTSITRFVELIVQGQHYTIDADQKFYLANKKAWKKAHTLCAGDMLLGVHGQTARIEAVHCCTTETPIELYTLSVTPYHNFCISCDEFITHNMDYVLTAQQSALVLAASTTLALSCPVVLAIQGGCLAALGITLIVEHIQEQNKHKQFNAFAAAHQQSGNKTRSCSSPLIPPQDPEEEEKSFFEKLKIRSDKEVVSKRFGKIYRDPKTKLWWSRDNAHHSGPHYKVFKEGARGFEWQFDADTLGQTIINKHKGPIGRFISYKEVVFLR